METAETNADARDEKVGRLSENDLFGESEEHWILQYVKKPFGILVYCLLMFVYVPFYIIGYLMVQKKILLLKLKKATGIGYVEHGKLGIVSRRSRVTDISAVSTDNELDFLLNRSPGYLWRMCFSMPWELVKTVLRQEKIQLISDEQLAYTILNTVFAHSVRWDEERKMYRLVMEGFEDLFLFQGFYWDARDVLIRPDCKKIIIQMSDGSEYASDCDPKLRPTYNLAKLHVQVCLTYFAPGLSHNHVHFVLPSALAVISRTKLNPDGVLYKLFYQHFRFTERINYQALRIQKATNNKRSILDRLFFFWQPIPLTKEQFLEGVAKKCKKHYFDEGQKKFDACVKEAEELCKSNPENIMEELKERTHSLFPPKFVTDEHMRKVPYMAFLTEYYIVTREFVRQLIPFIDKEEWKDLSREVTNHVPRFDESNVIDAIATSIHQVGLMHFCDHDSYLRYFAFRYGSMAMRVPFEPFENVDDWEAFEEEHGIDARKVKNDPLRLIRQRDVLRTRSFLKIFGGFIPTPGLDLSLANTEYNFGMTGPDLAAAKFKENLRTLDKKLKNMESALPISTNPGEHRGEGLRLVPLEEIVRTVCF